MQPRLSLTVRTLSLVLLVLGSLVGLEVWMRVAGPAVLGREDAPPIAFGACVLAAAAIVTVGHPVQGPSVAEVVGAALGRAFRLGVVAGACIALATALFAKGIADGELQFAIALPPVFSGIGVLPMSLGLTLLRFGRVSIPPPMTPSTAREGDEGGGGKTDPDPDEKQ